MTLDPDPISSMGQACIGMELCHKGVTGFHLIPVQNLTTLPYRRKSGSSMADDQKHVLDPDWHRDGAKGR